MAHDPSSRLAELTARLDAVLQTAAVTAERLEAARAALAEIRPTRRSPPPPHGPRSPR